MYKITIKNTYGFQLYEVVNMTISSVFMYVKHILFTDNTCQIAYFKKHSCFYEKPNILSNLIFPSIL